MFFRCDLTSPLDKGLPKLAVTKDSFLSHMISKERVYGLFSDDFELTDTISFATIESDMSAAQHSQHHI
ncbi:767_t:CDS:2 [Funneliformis mosseae]|uniref:767_t:CDS:1 n=1 Tax=Funneliformis mosseae TaxID=27381 RepID=A0A9N9DJ67_FUNMO|nr:767_t:CDS:2 [Funneliformis mosseae]